MLILKMAFRNIFRQRRRTILTGLSMLAGYFLSVVFIGWSDGTYNDIIQTFTANRLGHIQIHEKTYLDQPSLYKTIDELSRIGGIFRQVEEIQSWAPRLFSAGLASIGEKSAGVQIFGIDPEKETATTHFDKKIIEGHNFSPAPSHEAVIGKGVAELLDAEINDEIVIISQAADGSIANDLYTIIGISSSGNDINDRTSFYLNLRDAQDLLVLNGRVHEIAITVDKLNHVSKVTEIITEKLDTPELVVEPWQIFAKSFYQAMQADKQGMWIMLVIIIVIVAVGVLNTVLMAVLERRREYGLLKAVGTKPRNIIKLVLLEVAILAVFSILLGGILGFGTNSFLSSQGIKIGEGFTFGGMTFDTMYAEVNIRSFIIPAVTVLLCSTLVSLYPSFKAARTEPAKTMRIY
ncbi:MAG: FtsX-like permease family protein [Candidatus Aminicenantes bacterium]|jgi:ABC-type lipoprotein release transport system permease subunit